MTFSHIANLIPEKKGSYLVGGAVRDMILGRTAEDYDLAVSQNPKTVAAQIAKTIKGSLVEMGRPGQQIFRVVSQSLVVDVSALNGSTIEQDLRQRDFTINSLAYSFETNNLIDCTGGLDDSKEKILRMVSPQAFIKDPLRLVRAFRLSASLNFSIDAATTSAIAAHASSIMQSASDRIRSEMFKLFESPNAYPCLCQMTDTGLLFYILPEMIFLKGCTQNRYHEFDVIEHTFNAFARLEAIINTYDQGFGEISSDLEPYMKNAALIKWSVLFHDIGKPSTKTIDSNGGIHFYGHDAKGAKIAETIALRLRFSTQNIQQICFIIQNHLRPLNLFTAHQKGSLTRKAITRFFMKCGQKTPLLMIHSLADNYGKKGGPDDKAIEFTTFIKNILRDFFENFQPAQSMRPLLTGHDLIQAFGLKPSPLFKKILTSLEEERLSRQKMTRQDALNWVKFFLDQ